MVHTWSTACLRADPQGPGISKSVPPCGSPFHKSLTDVPRPWLRHAGTWVPRLSPGSRFHFLNSLTSSNH